MKNSTFDLFLASQSPRRRELLEQIGVRFSVVDVDVPEIKQTNESPADYVQRLAQSKAQAGWELNKTHPTLGADTIVVLQDKVLEKPDSEAHAAEILQLLSGQTHQVITAVAIVNAEKTRVIVNVTDVSFRQISQPEIEDYWQSGEPRDKAGAYGIQGLGGIFVKAIRGSYSSVVGLPLYETASLLKEFDVPVWHSSKR
jgi:septum formation protein